MTALNTFVTPLAIHLTTDGASYLPDGRVVHEGQKVAILAHLPAVIAVRGPTMLIPSIVANVSANFTGFDPLAAAAPALFRAMHEQYCDAMAARGPAGESFQDAEFVLAGWSAERECLEAYGVESHSRNGRRPWSLFPIEGGAISPSDSALIERIGSLDLDELLTDPERMALHIMEAQRERPFEIENGRSAVAAGAFCQLTTLTRDGITTRILKRWPDAVAA